MLKTKATHRLFFRKSPKASGTVTSISTAAASVGDGQELLQPREEGPVQSMAYNDAVNTQLTEPPRTSAIPGLPGCGEKSCDSCRITFKKQGLLWLESSFLQRSMVTLLREWQAGPKELPGGRFQGPPSRSASEAG